MKWLTKINALFSHVSIQSIQLHADGFSIADSFSIRLSNFPKRLKSVLSSVTLLGSYLIPGVKAHTEDLHFSNPSSITDYKASASHSYTTVLDHIKDGACGALTNVTKIPLQYTEIEKWNPYGYAVFSRGDKQAIDSDFETCIKHHFDERVDELNVIHQHDGRNVGIILGVIFGSVAAVTLSIIFMNYVRKCKENSESKEKIKFMEETGRQTLRSYGSQL